MYTDDGALWHTEVLQVLLTIGTKPFQNPLYTATDQGLGIYWHENLNSEWALTSQEALKTGRIILFLEATGCDNLILNSVTLSEAEDLRSRLFIYLFQYGLTILFSLWLKANNTMAPTAQKSTA